MRANIVSTKNTNLHSAESELVQKINRYTENGWHIQGGISHVISQPTDSEPKFHYLSVIIAHHGSQPE